MGYHKRVARIVPVNRAMQPFRRLIESIEAEGAGALVSLVRTEGSSPREAGARMVVRPSGGFHGTIGGGEMEWRALAEARAALASGRGAALRSVVALGPELGQCCGGRVEWRIETFDARDRETLAPLAAAERAGAFAVVARNGAGGRVERSIEGEAGAEPLARGAWRETFGDGASALYLFGAGHVGRSLVLTLAPLPFAVRWIDSRADAFPERAPLNATLVHAGEPQGELAGAPDGALVVVMTHSHPLDLAIVAEALRQDRFAYVGLIGSATKRARFVNQMRAAGLAEERIARLVCPIGLPGIEGKEPAVIAASVAAQLLMARGGE
ncbi:MAG: xanthine dehydrogenase accessory protein XdhC [Roseiarcus sp.]|jgi:xanthine dehydrogenase accessory factor